MQLKMKLAGNPELFPNDTVKMQYAFSLFRKDALTWAEPYIQRKAGYELDDFDEFENAVETAFGDPNPKATAEQKLRELRQGNKEVATYLTEFNSIIAHLNINNESIVTHFRFRLNDRIKERLIRQTVPDNFADFARHINTLDNELRAFEMEKKYKGSNLPRGLDTRYTANTGRPTWKGNNLRTNHGPFRTNSERYVEKRTEYRPPSDYNRRSTSSNNYYGPGPMELGATHQRPSPQ